MCADVEGFVTEISERGIFCGPVQDMGWGRLTQLVLPGGGKLGVYEPRHARPRSVALPPRKKKRRAAAKRSSAKPAKKKGSARARKGLRKKRAAGKGPRAR
jgi:hypothetical protein